MEPYIFYHLFSFLVFGTLISSALVSSFINSLAKASIYTMIVLAWQFEESNLIWISRLIIMHVAVRNHWAARQYLSQKWLF